MDQQFERKEITCLDTAVREVQNIEQAQELKLSDGMPDIGRIISAWGQVVLRGKEWRADRISCSGGILIWVLYAPEDGSTERCIDSWIPFQVSWDLPDNCPEGQIRLSSLLRFVDARNVSPRKIMVRAGVGTLAEAYVPRTEEVYVPDQASKSVELLRNTYPIRLCREAGEKTFQMDEELSLPDSIPKPEKLICYRLNPWISERKVLADKIVFRGTGNLHVLYRSEDGQLYSWDFELPFSQFAELDQEYGTDAQVDLVLSPTGMELERMDDGRLRFKGAAAAQYVISDKQLISVVEDAYSPGRELQQQKQSLQLPAILETRRETVYGEQTLPAMANVAVDTTFLPDFPRQRRTDDGIDVELSGSFQVLYYGEDGALSGASSRWEGQQHWNAAENSCLTLIPMAPQAQSLPGNGQLISKAELPVEITVTAVQEIPMVTGLSLGEAKAPDPARPSLILRRAGEKSLWEMARDGGSTMAAIRQANGLQEDPQPGQMLLIPITG